MTCGRGSARAYEVRVRARVSAEAAGARGARHDRRASVGRPPVLVRSWTAPGSRARAPNFTVHVWTYTWRFEGGHESQAYSLSFLSFSLKV